MMDEKRDLDKILSINDIKRKTSEAWNVKSAKEKLRIAKKFSHLFDDADWNADFKSLTPRQQFVLLKGEIIRRYDLLPNSDKTIIKHELKLSHFQSKWFKLHNCDKHKLLKYVLSFVN